jgi:hypothetical protein
MNFLCSASLKLCLVLSSYFLVMIGAKNKTLLLQRTQIIGYMFKSCKSGEKISLSLPLVKDFCERRFV